MRESMVQRTILSSERLGEDYYRVRLTIEDFDYIAWIVLDGTFLFVEMAKNYDMIYEMVDYGNEKASVDFDDDRDDAEILQQLTPQFFKDIFKEIAT